MNRILFTKYVSITRTQLIEAKEVTVIRPEFMDELASVVKLAD